MANTQTSRSSGESKRKNVGSPRSEQEEPTGERDENYNLISVLYHALHGADTIGQYMRDSENGGDEELMQFFDETRAQYAELAAEAKRLLAERLVDNQEGHDVGDDNDDE